MRPLVAILVAACGAAPPPKPADRPVTALGDIEGRWSASTEVDWAYTLSIDADGAFDLVIDRNKMGRCEDRGSVSGAAPAFRLAYIRNECDRTQPGVVPFEIAHFTGDSLTVVIAGDKRTFTRAQQ